MSPFLLWFITLVLFGAGLAGILIPALPGVGLVFAGVLIYGWATHWDQISGTTVAAMGLATLIISLADWYGSGLATRFGGGKRKAFWGTLIGGLIGLMVASFPGFFLGALVGALLGALAEGKSPEQAGKIAAFSLLGMIGGKILQLVFALSMIIAFFLAVAW